MSYTGNKWTSDEISKAVELFKKGKDYSSISEKLDGRTAFAVQCKLEYYVYDKINSNTSYDNLAKDLKRSESDLKKMYESQQNRNPGKTNSNTGSVGNSITSSSSNVIFTPSPNNTYGIINRVLTPYIEYHSNLEKLEKLSKSETISNKMFKNIKKILENLSIDEDKFLEQLKSTVETKKISPVKSDTISEESDNGSDSDTEPEEDTKKKTKKDTKKGSNKKEKEEKQGSTKINIPKKRIL